MYYTILYIRSDVGVCIDWVIEGRVLGGSGNSGVMQALQTRLRSKIFLTLLQNNRGYIRSSIATTNGPLIESYI